jgi:hypothetical protein
MKAGIAAVLFLLCLGALADQTAQTSDGRTVLLRDDGTWAYAEASEGFPLSIVDWNVAKMPADYEKDRYDDQAWLYLLIRNETSNPVKGWRVRVHVKSAFGDLLGKLELTAGQSKIGPGETTDAMFSFDDNPFIDGEPFDYLTNYDKDTMLLELADAKVVQ